VGLGKLPTAEMPKPTNTSTLHKVQRAITTGQRLIRPPNIIAIGVSTGGPKALEQVIPNLPANLPIPIVVVQHMPPMFTELLAERLNAQSKLAVGEGYEGAPLEAGQVWIAPGGYHMEVEGSRSNARLRLHEGPMENSCRPAVDVLFRSVVHVYGGHALGVILTGMGQDGLRGSEVLHKAGGRIIAQDEATSTVWGMPGAVARAGLADRIVPIDQVWTEIVTLVRAQRHESTSTESWTGTLGQ
ncbi:MAG: CheB methylesterase domain-containing protein, partial [Myxococcota bacterium]